MQLLPILGEYNWFAGLMVTALVAWTATEAVIRLASRHLPPPVLFWIPLLPLAAVYLDALGDFVHWYARFEWYDQLTHFAGGAASAGLLYALFASWLAGRRYPAHPWALAFMVISVTALAGSLYEIEEYLEDRFRGTAMRLGDGPDTASDILLNLLGATTVVIPVTLSSRKSQKVNHSQNS